MSLDSYILLYRYLHVFSYLLCREGGQCCIKIGILDPSYPCGCSPYPPPTGNGGGVDLDGPTIATAIKVAPVPILTIDIGAASAIASTTIGGGACSTSSMTTLSRYDVPCSLPYIISHRQCH